MVPCTLTTAELGGLNQAHLAPLRGQGRLVEEQLMLLSGPHPASGRPQARDALLVRLRTSGSLLGASVRLPRQPLANPAQLA